MRRLLDRLSLRRRPVTPVPLIKRFGAGGPAFILVRDDRGRVKDLRKNW